MTAVPRYSQFLNDLLNRLAVSWPSGATDEEPTDDKDLVEACSRLLAGSGEVRSVMLARSLLKRLNAMDDTALEGAMSEIARAFGPPSQILRAALNELDPDDPVSVRRLHAASEPRSQELLRRLNQAPGGTSALVALRARLLKLRAAKPDLKALDGDFHHLFSSWFNRGFLDLQRIDWSTSAEILERIIQYEAVHAISDWEDLKRRVDADDRRLYAFFHPALPHDPLIFVEVALTARVSETIDSILSQDRSPLKPQQATTAVFYSISNCQKGLTGVSFGNFLIKQVVDDLRRELPEISSFVTLSPVPGLRRWVEAVLTRSSQHPLPDRLRPLASALLACEAEPEALRSDALVELAAIYLVNAKRQNGTPADPVARFHLGNGARLDRINLTADSSLRGQRDSWGVMVNYRYELDDIERNQDAFATRTEVVASDQVRQHIRS